MKALVGAFNQEKALVGAFSVIVQEVVEPIEHYTALIAGLGHVILGILNGQRHLPFKESKVTQLLREVLGSVSCQVGVGTRNNPREKYHHNRIPSYFTLNSSSLC